MPTVFKDTEREFYMSDWLAPVLDTARDVVKDDWDMVFIIDGREGAGKSVFTQQCARYLDPTFCLDRIVFNPDDFKKAIMSAEKYQAIVYDEAYGGLSSRGAIRQVNQMLVQLATIMRDRNLFVFVVLPSIFYLDKYYAIERSRALFHIYTGDKFQRGYFAYYNYDDKEELIGIGKKLNSRQAFKMVKPGFTGRFPNKWMVDIEAYKAKKREQSIEPSQNEGKVATLRKELLVRIANGLKSARIRYKLTNECVAEIMEITRMTLHNYEREQKEKEEFKSDDEPAVFA